jgi:hypothetical protein
VNGEREPVVAMSVIIGSILLLVVLGVLALVTLLDPIP